MKLHEYTHGNKTATIYQRGNGYRVFLYDFYTEYTNEVFFKDEQEAEDYAEEWVVE